MSIPAAQEGRLRRRAFRLEYATMAWMVAEAAVAITAGLLAASIALVGFGLDSVIEPERNTPSPGLICQLACLVVAALPRS